MLAAFGLQGLRSRLKPALYGLLALPRVIPRVMVAVALFYCYARLGLVGSFRGLVRAHTVRALPFAVITISATLQGFEPNLPRAAASLGASPLRAFRKVTPPLDPSRRIVGSGLRLRDVVFDELLVILFVGSPEQRTLPPAGLERCERDHEPYRVRRRRRPDRRFSHPHGGGRSCCCAVAASASAAEHPCHESIGSPHVHRGRSHRGLRRHRAHRLLRDGIFVYEADRIVHVGAGPIPCPRDTVVDARGMLAIPGQISGHAHVSAQEGGRLLMDGGRRRLLPLGLPAAICPRAATAGRRSCATRTGAPRCASGWPSLIRHGITALRPRGRKTSRGGSHARVVLSGRYFFDNGGRLNRVVDEAAGLRGLEATAAFIQKHDGAANGRIRGIVTIDEFYNATPRLLRDARALATRLGVGLTMHFCEQVLESQMVLGQLTRVGPHASCP